MPQKRISLSDLLHSYVVNHNLFLSDSYKSQLANSISVFKQFMGREPDLGDLTTPNLNSFLVYLKAEGRKDKTIKHRRNSLLVLWKWAFEEMLTDFPPRAKRVVLRPSVPVCWTQEQICSLIQEMAEDSREMKNGMLRGIWFASLTMALYSSGLRLSDLLKARKEEVSPDGQYTLTQEKTGRLAIRILDPRAVKLAINTGPPARELIWDLPYNRTWVFKHWRSYTRKVGLEGTTRWIRRSSATHTCQQQGIEEARKLLDHRSISTLVNHYLGELDSFRHSGPLPLCIT